MRIAKFSCMLMSPWLPTVHALIYDIFSLVRVGTNTSRIKHLNVYIDTRLIGWAQTSTAADTFVYRIVQIAYLPAFLQ